MIKKEKKMKKIKKTKKYQLKNKINKLEKNFIMNIKILSLIHMKLITMYLKLL